MFAGENRAVALGEMLDARERRAAAQREMIERHGLPLVSFTLNVPGPVKDSALLRRAFDEGLQQIGASVEDAALNLGANSFRSFKDVIIPLLKAPFMSSFVLSFLRSVTCLSVVIFLYAPSTTVGTISVMVLVQSGQYGEAAAFTIVLITIAFTVLKLAQWVLGKQGIELEL